MPIKTTELKDMGEITRKQYERRTLAVREVESDKTRVWRSCIRMLLG